VTRLEVGGHRFLLRRTAHLLVRRDVRMLDDPLRAQSVSLTTGAVLAAVALAGWAVFGALWPTARPGDGERVLIVRETGAVYVRIDRTWHPATDLNSARLVAGSFVSPRAVDRRVVDTLPRGPSVGIPGAPAALGPQLGADAAAWTVCTGTDTTVFVGVRPPAAAPLGPGRALLVRTAERAPSYLVYRGRRAEVDLRDPAVVRALRLEGAVPQQVPPVLLDVLPELPPLAPPRIPGLGEPGAVAGHPVGTVLRVERADVTEFHLVLRDGVQRVGPVTADLVRFGLGAALHTVEAGAIAAAPVVDTLPVHGHPDRAGVVAPAVVCAEWAAGTVRVWGADAPPPAPTVRLAQADGPGPRVDAVGLPAGRSAYVRSATLAGAAEPAAPRFVVTDTGVAFGVADDAAAEALGLTDPVPAPWPVLAHLPRGPELSIAAASLVRDAAG